MSRTAQTPDSLLTRYRRPPEQVMRLARLGSFHQTRLSFMRSLLRRLKHEQWQFKRPVWEIDNHGFGRAVYSVIGPERSYSLVAFSHALPDHLRSDRVIATAWDCTFALFDGIPVVADLDRLAQNVPKQEAGRLSDSELSLSRANRSVRLWEHVIERLARGQQPDPKKLESVGYLVRTTAVYGSGKFGAADRLGISDRPELSAPFQAEMLSVWLTRSFSIDLVEHIAHAKVADKAVSIDPDLRRRIGVGNSTGLGMAPFMINHPALINNWIVAREEAFARVRALPAASSEEIEHFKHCFKRARENVSQWFSEHPVQVEKLRLLNADLLKIAAYIESDLNQDAQPWERFYRWSEDRLSMEGQEQLLALMLEPYSQLVDGLSQCMDADEHRSFFIDGSMPLSRVNEIIRQQCGWATSVDYRLDSSRARFWYTSAEKLEPRLGERFEEAGAEYEQPYSIGYFISLMYTDLHACDPALSVADFLLAYPEHRHTLRRVQNLVLHPYAEVQDNLIAAEMLPIDLLRCKLSFFGATKFDPRSDRWVRICMYQGADFPHELLSPAP